MKANKKSPEKEPTVDTCLLTLDFNPFRSQVKGKHSVGTKFQIIAVQGNELLTERFL